VSDVFISATLKDDDAEDSGDEEEENEALTRESKVFLSEGEKGEKQPTGRIVGIIKRNWRA
jgi:exosome complex exonuclease DIS3/RRP44